MKTLTLLALTILSAAAAKPLGTFDFDLRGETPAAQIHSLDGIGFSGITMWMNGPADLRKFEAYQKAEPEVRLIAGLILLDARKPESINRKHLAKVVSKLASMEGELWLIVGGDKDDNEAIVSLIRSVADIAAAGKVGVSLYPHDNQAIETAEEALVYLNLADRPNLTLSIHQCHELRAGNIDRLDEVVKATAPFADFATVCGSDREMHDTSKGWSDAIKPLGEGDFDPKIFLRALKRNGFKGQVVLHTFGLKDKPADHWKKSFAIYQEMAAEVDAEP